jgi:hypothetical protein
MAYNAVIPVSFDSTGDNVAIAGVEGKKIAIYGLDLFLATSGTLELKAGETTLTGAMTLTEYRKGLLLDDPAYWYVPEGEDFVLTLAADVQLSGTIWYRQQ